MKLYIFLGFLSTILIACQKTEVDSNPSPQILRATVLNDPSSIVEVDQNTSIISVTLAPFNANRPRSLDLNIKFQSTLKAVVTSANIIASATTLLDTSSTLSINLAAYDNTQPARLCVHYSDRSTQKKYQLQIHAAGSLHFESLASRKDTMITIASNAPNVVSLPISNLYDGQPGTNKIYALSKDNPPIQLEQLSINAYNSEDYIYILLYNILDKPGIYTLELHKADGQIAVSPTRILIRK